MKSTILALVMLTLTTSCLMFSVTTAVSNIIGDPENGTVVSDGSVLYFNGYVGDTNTNVYRRMLVKFSLDGISGTVAPGAKLNLYLFYSYVDFPPNLYTVSPLPNPGLGDLQVIHVDDYDTLDASDFNAPSIGNDPGILIGSGQTANTGYTSIDVTNAMQDDLDNGRDYSAFMIKLSIGSDSDGNWDGYYLYATEPDTHTNDPFISYVLRAPVGGIVLPTNKLETLTPYIALVGLIIATSIVYIIKRSKD